MDSMRYGLNLNGDFVLVIWINVNKNIEIIFIVIKLNFLFNFLIKICLNMIFLIIGFIIIINKNVIGKNVGILNILFSLSLLVVLLYCKCLGRNCVIYLYV